MRVHNRLDGSETVMDVFLKLAEGNPGAVIVCAKLYKEEPLALFHLDNLGIYGSEIWVLYKDLCHEDLGLTIMALLDPQHRVVGQLESLKVKETQS